jgi:hypothetical protein
MWVSAWQPSPARQCVASGFCPLIALMHELCLAGHSEPSHGDIRHYCFPTKHTKAYPSDGRRLCGCLLHVLGLTHGDCYRYPSRDAEGSPPTVQERNGKWQMCTDFTDLNNCLPKDDFPLTRIDKIVDSTTGCEMMALLDCFSGYYQIWLHKEDEKISFITPFDTYCYLRMPKGLRNAGPTFEGGTKRSSGHECVLIR